MLVAPSFVTTSIHVLSFSCETARDPHSFLFGLKGKVLDGWNDTWTEKDGWGRGKVAILYLFLQDTQELSIPIRVQLTPQPLNTKYVHHFCPFLKINCDRGAFSQQAVGRSSSSSSTVCTSWRESLRSDLQPQLFRKVISRRAAMIPAYKSVQRDAEKRVSKIDKGIDKRLGFPSPWDWRTPTSSPQAGIYRTSASTSLLAQGTKI